MPAAFYVGMFFALLAILAGWSSVLSGLASVQAVDDRGIVLRTLTGRSRLAWLDVTSPVLFEPRWLLVHIVIRPRRRSFFALRSAFLVVASLEVARSLASEIAKHVSVEESRSF